MSGRARARGFTLIEVLVALVIVAIGMAAVLGALSSSANTLSFLRDKTFAQWVALNQIAHAAPLRPAAADRQQRRRHATSPAAAGTGARRWSRPKSPAWCAST